MAQPKQDSGKKLFVVSTHMLKKSDFNGSIELLPKTTTLLKNLSYVQHPDIVTFNAGVIRTAPRPVR